MTQNVPNVIPSAHYELKAASEALGITRATLLRYTHNGSISAKTSMANGRKFWLGADILRLWNSCM